MSQLIEIARKEINSSQEELNDDSVKEIINRVVLNNKELYSCQIEDIRHIRDRIFMAIRKELDVLDSLARDQNVSEIMVNGKDQIFVEEKGVLRKVSLSFETTQELEEVITRIVSKVHREINLLNPIVDARLQDGSRVNAVYKNIAIEGPVLTIRKFPQKAIDMEFLIKKETITKDCAQFLRKLVQSGYNIFISGGTSSGKTTLLNVLSDYIPPNERVIVIEDSAELQINNIENLVRLECKKANSQGKGEVDMSSLIKTSLRMRPDRIIVGEVRGKEVVDMLQAMNTGHAGSLSTGHGNSVKGMLRRLETMMMQSESFPLEAIRGQITEGIDILVHLGKIRDEGRKILEVAELLEYQGKEIPVNTLYKYSREGGLEATKNQLINKEKILLNVEK